MQAARHHHRVPLGDAARHHGGLCARCGAVIHRGIGDLHAGEGCNLRLEFEHRLQRALRDFRLVGRVGCEEFRALDDVVYAGRNVVLVSAAADEERAIRGRAVLACELRHVAFDLHLAGMIGQAFDRAFQAGRSRHIAIEIVYRLRADGLQHRRTVVWREGEVAHRLCLLGHFGRELLRGMVAGMMETVKNAGAVAFGAVL